jgi:polysaccharide biosynthesis transport protein
VIEPLYDDLPARRSQDRVHRADRGRDEVRDASIEYAEAIEYAEEIRTAAAPAIDFVAILCGVLKRWKLITAITLSVSIATYGVLKLVPSLYKSTVEILVFDPQRQIDATVQKPISPFVDAIGSDAMSTEIKVIMSKSVAIRVAQELGLDSDPEFQRHNLLADLAKRWGFPRLGGTGNNGAQTIDGAEEQKAEKLDEAADILLKKMEVGQDSYIISVAVSSQNPIKAQRLAATVASDYLADQREARQEALQRVAAWLKDRLTNLHSHVLETEASIEKLRATSGITDGQANNVKEQTGDLNTQLMTARADVDEQRVHLEQAHRVLDTNGDIESIPELTASATLTQLRQKQTELSWRAADLRQKLGDGHAQVIAIQAALDGVNKQINAEAQHILGNMKNAYDIAAQREQSLEASLQSLTSRNNSETSLKLQQLERVADADRNLYDSYLFQYNEVSERSTLQDASARIISPASLPRSPSSSRLKLYALGGMSGVAGGLVLAFLLEYFRSGVKSSEEAEQSFGRPVMGLIPLLQRKEASGPRHKGLLRRITDEPLSRLPAMRMNINPLDGKSHCTPYDQLLQRLVDEPHSQFSEAVHGIRISLELSSANPKVILVTSALPAEGKSTTAMLLAASSASSGKRTVLLDCDLRRQSSSAALQNKHEPGLSELLGGTAQLMDVLIEDAVTKAYLIPAGRLIPNTADLLMSQRMRDLIADLRCEFDYIVMDTAPLLPVVDALALATVSDKILMIVEWGQTPHATISEAFKVLRPEAHRVAGIVLNKVDFKQLPGYGGYPYRSVGKYFGNA